MALVLSAAAVALAQQAGPSQGVEQITEEVQRTPEAPFSIADRPIYRALQGSKKELSEKYGINWPLEDTAIYQTTSGGVATPRPPTSWDGR